MPDLPPLACSSFTQYIPSFVLSSPFTLSFLPVFPVFLLHLSCYIPSLYFKPPPLCLIFPSLKFFSMFLSITPPSLYFPVMPSSSPYKREVYLPYSLSLTCPSPFLDEIAFLEGMTIVYKSSIDLFFYVVGSAQENEVG